VALVVSLDTPGVADAHRLLDELAAIAEDDDQRAAGAKYPRRYPGRSTDALRVLHACTDARTGAVVASPTTSLPEVVGGDRQFDYRYSWLRDASLAVSVAALVGRRDLARRYLDFVLGQLGGGVPTAPVTDIRGGPVPPERQVPGVSGWGGSQPVRVGNAAADQVQYDALGLLVEAVSVYLQLGAPLEPDCWEVVQAIADHMLDSGPEETSGIWELRQPRRLLSADIGRWLALDRAMWIARGWRPWTRRRRWKRARDETRDRILAALDDDGGLSQSYDDDRFVPDASALMAVIFGLLDRRDERAGRLVDVTLAHLDAWPFLYRYEPGGDDGFEGKEGAFLPTSWWAISALAKLGRVEEASQRLAALDRAAPRLMSEEIDPESLQALGNAPLVWSYMEAVRALYILDAEERRQRTGRAGLWTWRIARYLQQRTSGP
jgi:GH15 family glucan-1,4-alpha-glucosidase